MSWLMFWADIVFGLANVALGLVWGNPISWFAGGFSLACAMWQFREAWEEGA